MPPPATSIPASNSLWSPLDTVKDAAESLGIGNLPNDVANVLAMDIEYRIFQITEQALKFMRHSKRKTLSTRDINKALKTLNVEPLYGYNVSRPLQFKQALVGPGQTLYYIDDNMIDFEKLINSPLPKVPRLVTFTAHWLAIEGVQPSIPQNPSLAEIKALPPSERGSIQNLILNSNSVLENQPAKDGVAAAAAAAANNNNSKNKTSFDNNNLQIKPLIKHVISKELQLYFNKIIQVLTSSPTNNPEFEYLKNSALVSLRSDPGLHQLVPYFIQFISETITNNLGNIALLHIMLESIYSLLLNEHIFLDPYIHSLLPCILTLLLAKRIGKVPSLKNIGANGNGNGNGNIDTLIEDYLDEILAIREFAAGLLDHILKHYGSNYNTLKPRVARTLLKALLQSSINDASLTNGVENGSTINATNGSSNGSNNNNENGNSSEKSSSITNDENQNLEKAYSKNLYRNFGSYYGAIVGIRKLGTEIIRLILLGNLKIWSEFVYFGEKRTGNDNATNNNNNNNSSDDDVEMEDAETNAENNNNSNNDNAISTTTAGGGVTDEQDLTKKIVNKQKTILISAVTDTLRELKKDAENRILLKKEEGGNENDKLKLEQEQEQLQLQQQQQKLDEKVYLKLKERVGDNFAAELAKQQDALAVAEGIFFGEV